MRRALLALALLFPALGAGAEEPRDETLGFIPRIAVYVPEGQAEIRLSKLVRSSLYETQFEYDFVSGDIAAYLRYKYYGARQSFTISAFDRVSFAALESLALGYDRVRGLSAFVRRPVGLYGRLVLLAEVDRFNISQPDAPLGNVDDGQTNLFGKAGFQWGTEDDNLGNRISGDPNDRMRNLFTVARSFGPGRRGFSIGVTYGAHLLDYSYLKVEGEAIQAVPVGRGRLVGRLHAGFFPYKPVGTSSGPPGGLPYLIPGTEYFSLGGRDALKGLREAPFGTEEVHATIEAFLPVFVARNAEFLKASWDTLYAVVYVGTGNAGVGGTVYTRFGEWRQDAGLGFEVSFRILRYRVFASALAAREVGGPGSPKFLMTIRTVN
ncbi:MAG: hypothetical protein IPP07_12965 [Holophagales bacterium]|nr:hypothetical protein [Holophagales bacterium]MBK9965764.1 hypothetical protein [Holophagales bacterium]